MNMPSIRFPTHLARWLALLAFAAFGTAAMAQQQDPQPAMQADPPALTPCKYL